MHYQAHADDLAAAGLEHPPVVYQARFCALWCLSDQVDPADWVAGLLADGQAPEDPELARNALLALVEATAASLADDEYGWALALPDDDTPILDRVTALAEWCDAFVLGLAQAGLGERPALGEEASEFVADLQAIARVDATAATTDDDGALEELIEYIRMGVMVVKGECTRGRELH